MSKRIQRPRLEVTMHCPQWGTVDSEYRRVNVGGADECISLTIKDAKRLHAFLSKAINYLQMKEGKKK